MSSIPWDPTLETGNEMIDAQHKQLFALVDRLRDAAVEGHTEEAVTEVLAGLVDYVETHFAEEQRLMARSGYPVDELVSHIEAHTTLTAQTAEIVERQHRGELTTVLPVAEFLFEWLRTHIRQVDKRFAEFVRTRQIETI